MKIGFVTSTAEKLQYYFPTLAEPAFIPVEPPFTPDDQLAVNELRKNGYEVKPIVWGCPINTLGEFDLVVIRSPWDYMDSDENKTRFMQWVMSLEQTGIRVANPAKFMQWMLDKHYLRDLSEEGIAVISTQYYEKKSYLNLLEQFAKQGQFIVKPCVSAAGMGLYHIKSVEDAMRYQKEIDARMQTSSYMLQDFISEITLNGEWSLIFLGGKYSHSIHKMPGQNSILVHAERGGSLSFSNQPGQSIIDFANHAYNKVFAAFKKVMKNDWDNSLVLYLRLDVIETNSGPVLIECEGVEPELFFRAQPKSETVFCKGIASIL